MTGRATPRAPAHPDSNERPATTRGAHQIGSTSGNSLPGPERAGGIVIRRSEHTQRFVVLANEVARDPGLSLTAHGLLVYLLSLRPGTPVRADAIADLFPDSRTAVRKAMRELRDQRYAILRSERGDDGQTRSWYEVFDTPQPDAGTPRLVPPAETRNETGSALVTPDAGRAASGVTSANGHSRRSHQTRGARALMKDGRKNHQRDALIKIVIEEIGQATGRTVGPRWAERILAGLMDGRSVGSPAAYVRQAIRWESDPKSRFLSLYGSEDQS